MDIVKIERAFGVKLASGVTCAPGILIAVDSASEGQLGKDTASAVKPHGVALTSGSGTKTAGISQYVNCYRSATVYDENGFGVTLTPGSPVYSIDGGRLSTTQGGTTNMIVGFAIDANTAFIDFDVSQY